MWSNLKDKLEITCKKFVAACICANVQPVVLQSVTHSCGRSYHYKLLTQISVPHVRHTKAYDVTTNKEVFTDRFARGNDTGRADCS
jgi:hypothetical protein